MTHRAPDNKHILWLQVRVVPGNIKGGAAGKISATEWNEVCEPFTDRVIDILERYAPGIRKQIIERRVFSPQDLERNICNLIGGDSLSGSHHLSQNFFLRPLFSWSRWGTPISQLYMIDASTWPGAGVGAGSGFMLARQFAK